MKKQEYTFEMITTKGGDRGDTSLLNGKRTGKDDLVMEVLGDLDELGSFLGDLRSRLTESGLTGSAEIILEIQKNLFILGGEAALPPGDPGYSKIKTMTDRHIQALEKEEAALLKETSIEPVFAVAGGSRNSASADIARSVCRRAERHLVKLIRERGTVNLAAGQRYLNRLSDYLFILARSLD